jgi:hypothetical protein
MMIARSRSGPRLVSQVLELDVADPAMVLGDPCLVAEK